jgi:solute:Na+ symporter, SSS family
LYWKRLASKPVFWGMLLGAILAGLLTLTGYKTIYGIHGGVLGLTLNFIVCVVGSILVPVSSEQTLKKDELAVLELKA